MQKINDINEAEMKEQCSFDNTSHQTVPSQIDTSSTPLSSHGEGSHHSDITSTPCSKNNT